MLHLPDALQRVSIRLASMGYVLIPQAVLLIRMPATRWQAQDGGA